MVFSDPAVVLLSGGLDSATVLAIARNEGYDVHALVVDYGQRHRHELEAAKNLAQAAGVPFRIMPLDLRVFGGSALTDDIDVPHGRDESEMQEDIPVTYVPARNLIFLSLALGFAETIGAKDVFLGVNAVDYSGYPDCRPEFLTAFEACANLATKAGVQGQPFAIHAPLVDLTKAEIIQRGMALGVAYELTNSCYDPDPQGVPCHQCDSCVLRAKGFAEAGHPDPLLAATSSPWVGHAWRLTRLWR